LVAGPVGVDGDLFKGIDAAEADGDGFGVAELFDGSGVAVSEVPALLDPEGLVGDRERPRGSARVPVVDRNGDQCAEAGEDREDAGAGSCDGLRSRRLRYTMLGAPARRLHPRAGLHRPR
jgi:hypothetical protein